jgi:outer membrane protein assembly factor BamB
MIRIRLISIIWLWAAWGLAEDWPQWRGPLSNGTWPASQVLAPWTADGPPVVWKQTVGPGFSGIAVSGGRVYTLERLISEAESSQERVLCFDAATGTPLWQHAYTADYGDLDYGKGPRSTPTIHDGRVYTLGAVGHLFCLDALTGKVHWSKDLKSDHQAEQPTWGFAASPVIHKDNVIIHAGLKPNGSYVAFDRLTGREIWRAGDDPAGYCTPILVRHNNSELLIGWTPEHVLALSPAGGEIFWKVPYKVTYGVSIATPVYHHGIVLVSGYWEGSKAIRLGKEPDQAEVLWEENRYLRGLMDQPLVRDRHVYLLDKSHGLVCFELETGRMMWMDEHRLTPRGRNPQASLVWLSDSNRAVALNSDGELLQVRLTPEGYDELSRAKIVDQTWAHPAYANRCVFARDDSQIVCVRLAE